MFLWANYFTIFSGSASHPVEQKQAAMDTQLLCTLTMVLTGALTDGLLVWRCYMVQKVLMTTQSQIIRAISWVIPASLWLIMIAAGIAGAVITKHVTIPGRLASLSRAFLITSLAANIHLNLYSTIFIISRMDLYRRMIRDNFGTPTEIHRTRVVGMVLESASINVPITVIAVIGIATSGAYGDIMMSVVIPGQSFASVLVMYQIAIGKAIGAGPEVQSDTNNF